MKDLLLESDRFLLTNVDANEFAICDYASLFWIRLNFNERWFWGEDNITLRIWDGVVESFFLNVKRYLPLVLSLGQPLLLVLCK